MTAPLVATPFLEADDVAPFGETVARFLDRHAPPEALARWRKEKCVGRDLWRAAGAAGILGVSIPEEFGGGGGDFRHEVQIILGVGHRGAEGFGVTLHNPVLAHYLLDHGDDAQKRAWLPRMCSGEMVSALAMTEPGAGSDVQAIRAIARRVEGGYRLTGQKTFITNGQLADLVIIAARLEGTTGAAGISLFIADVSGAPAGFARGRNLDKVGQEAQDTSELFFDNLFIPAANLLGGVEGQGFRQLMQNLSQERLVIAWQAMAMIERALHETIAYVKERGAFGRKIVDFQNTQFRLAECKTEATIARVFANHCTERLLEKKLDAATASMAKSWISELLCRVVDVCVQLHGGYGYMLEYPIGQMYRDCRIHRIYGGTNEIMKLLIARTL